MVETAILVVQVVGVVALVLVVYGLWKGRDGGE